MRYRILVATEYWCPDGSAEAHVCGILTELLISFLSCFLSPGSSTCTCNGKHRSFQILDGSCECISGYVFYDETDQEQTEGNGDGDCQPRVDTRCELSQSRDASSRRCVDPSAVDCTTQCVLGSGGSYNVDLGRQVAIISVNVFAVTRDMINS